MTFRICGISPAPFLPLYGLPDLQLERHGARRYRVDEVPGFPDRVELRDACLGETVLLVNYTHQAAVTPYRASHAIFVREGALRAYDEVDQVPHVLAIRPISLRAFSDEHWMLDASLVPGSELAPAIERLLVDPAVAYLQAHYATRGCFAATITRG